jgi:hypothetical protein
MRHIVFGIVVIGSLALVTPVRGEGDPPADAPVVKLIAAGKAPKRTLRLAATAGHHEIVTMTMAMGMGMQSGGKDIVPMTRIPEIRMAIDLTVGSVTAGGDMRCTFKINEPEIATDASVDPQVVAAMKKAVVGMDGMSGYAVITNRGFTTEADFTTGPNLDPQLKQLLDGMRQSLRQLAAPLPAEPVGKGARWETTSKLVLNGMTMTQVATYELVELAGTTARLKVAMKQNAGRQKIQRGGVSIDLISLASSGTGEVTLDLTDLIASPATMSMKSAMEMEAAGQKMNMNITMTLGTKRK